MATVTLRTDDLDGTPDAQAVQLSVDGDTYEVDLSSANLRALHDALEPFLAVARVVNTQPQPPRRKRNRGGPEAVERSKIRAWGVDQGLMRADARGRIPAAVEDAYRARAE